MADPAAYMKDKGYTYGLLMNGDEVAKAYGIIGIPTFYVIGPDGKIVYAAAGYDPSAEGTLIALIESVLKKNE